MQLNNWVVDGVGDEPQLYERLCKANVIIFIDLPLKDYLRLAQEREKTPIETSPLGCSYEGMFGTVSKIIKRLDSTLIPTLRKEIPNIAKVTGAVIYQVTQPREKAHFSHNQPDSQVIEKIEKKDELTNSQQQLKLIQEILAAYPKSSSYGLSSSSQLSSATTTSSSLSLSGTFFGTSSNSGSASHLNSSSSASSSSNKVDLSTKQSPTKKLFSIT